MRNILGIVYNGNILGIVYTGSIYNSTDVFYFISLLYNHS